MHEHENLQLGFLDPITEFNSENHQIISIGARKLELALYDPFKEWLVGFWIPRQGYIQSIPEITAFGGRRPTGYWTRPDLAVLGLRAFPFLPGRNLEVVSFELKKSLEDGIPGIFETASHAAMAHRAFLAVQVDERDLESSGLFQRIRAECARLGLGFITFQDVHDWSTYVTVLDGECRSPDTAKVNHFISAQFSEDSKTQLLTLLR